MELFNSDHKYMPIYIITLSLYWSLEILSEMFFFLWGKHMSIVTLQESTTEDSHYIFHIV